MLSVLGPVASDAFIRHVLESLGPGVALFRENQANDDFTFVHASDSFKEFSGSSESELCGNSLSGWDPESDLRLGPLLSLVRETKEKACRKAMSLPEDRWCDITCIPLPENHFCISVCEITAEVRDRRELSRIRRLFNGLVEDSGALFCEFDAGGVLSYVNGASCTVAALTGEELLGKDFYRFIPEEQRQSVRDGIAGLSPENPYFPCEHQVINSRGEIFWLRWVNRAHFDEEGSVRGYYSVGFDVTACREAEEKRKEHSRHLEALFEHSPIAICLSREHMVCQVNRAFSSLFGLPSEEVTGKDMREIISQPGATRQECAVLVSRMDRGEMVTRDTVRYSADGRQIPVRIIGVPYEASDGSRGYFSFFQDLGDTMRLNKEMQRTRFVVEESPVVIFEAGMGFGAVCRFISENVSQFGYRSEDVISGRVLLDMQTHPDDLSRLRREVAEADREGFGYREYTYRLLTAEGRYRWVNERNRVLSGPDGKQESLIGVLIDQTDLIEAQEDLESSNKRLASYARELEKTWEETLLLLAGLTELRDPYTRGHQYRVAEMCGAIGKEMNLPEETLKELVQAAYIHDIGKMEIPSDYLNRPGRLLPEELDFIRDHPAKGYELLSKISGPALLPEIVYQHHERLDGSGYPRGLKEEELLLSSRILAVADVVEAMLSHRPYRPAFSLGAVMEEISRGAGRLYDRQVVEICLKLFHERGYRLPSVEDCR